MSQVCIHTDFGITCLVMSHFFPLGYTHAQVFYVHNVINTNVNLDTGC